MKFSINQTIKNITDGTMIIVSRDILFPNAKIPIGCSVIQIVKILKIFFAFIFLPRLVSSGENWMVATKNKFSFRLQKMKNSFEKSRQIFCILERVI